MKGLFLGNISPGGVKLAGNGKNLKTSLIAGKFSKNVKFSDLMKNILNKSGESKEEKIPVIGLVPVFSLSTNNNKKVLLKNNVKNLIVVNSTENVKTKNKTWSKLGKKIKLSKRLNNVKGLSKPKENVKLAENTKLQHLSLFSKPSVKRVNPKLTLSFKKLLKERVPKNISKQIEKTINPKIFTDDLFAKKGIVKAGTAKKELIKNMAKPKVKNRKNIDFFKNEKSSTTKVKEFSETNVNKVKFNKVSNTLLNDNNEAGQTEFKNNIGVRIITLKKGKTSMDEQVNKIVEKLNLKQNEPRVQGEIKNIVSDPVKQSAIIEKVMEALKIAQKQKPTHRAILELEPKSLGKIEVKISINHEQKVEIQVKAENPVVKNMVESSFSSLSSFVGQQSQNARNGNLNKKKSQFFIEDLEISEEEHVEIISQLMKDDKAINIII